MLTLADFGRFTPRLIYALAAKGRVVIEMVSLTGVEPAYRPAGCCPAGRPPALTATSSNLQNTLQHRTLPARDGTAPHT